jgi:GTP-binding protein Era
LAEHAAAAINKTDIQGSNVKRAMDFLAARLPGLSPARCFPVSCLKKEGTEALLACLFDMAGEGAPFYPEEYYTDQEVSFRIAEIIREKAIHRLRQELPHSIYVDVADTEMRDEAAGGRRLWVRAFIITERESQKGMVVGRGGEMIRDIRRAAQKELDAIFEWKTELDLRVKTGKDWRHNDHILRRIIS